MVTLLVLSMSDLVPMCEPQVGIGAGGPDGLGLGLVEGERVAIPGLRIETWGTHERPEDFGSSSFS
jgi:hypothetical protein